MSKCKIFVAGYAGHGKDTVCEILRDKYGLKYESTSKIAGKLAVYPILKDKYNYSSFEECYIDRGNHRAEWFELIKEYNKNDKARLCKEIFEENDIYCGIRNIEELETFSQQILDIPNEIRGYDFYIVWIDRSKFCEVEDSSSCTIHAENCPMVIDNNSTIEELKVKVDTYITCLRLVTLLTYGHYQDKQFTI